MIFLTQTETFSIFDQTCTILEICSYTHIYIYIYSSIYILAPRLLGLGVVRGDLGPGPRGTLNPVSQMRKCVTKKLVAFWLKLLEGT